MRLSLVAVTLAAVAGDQVAYLVGGVLAPACSGPAPKAISPERLEQARVLLDRHGAKAVVLSRFVPLARTLTRFLLASPAWTVGVSWPTTSSVPRAGPS